MYAYATLDDFKGYKSIDKTTDDALIRKLLRRASRIIDDYCDRRFDVRRASLLHDYPLKAYSEIGVYDPTFNVSLADEGIDQRLLRLTDDLLSAESVTNGDATSVAVADLDTLPANTYPTHSVRIKESSTSVWLKSDDGERFQVITVTGLWGYHPRFDDAFVDTLQTVQNNPLAAAGTSLTVSDIDGVAADLDTPTIAAGHLIQFSSGANSEFALVTATDTATNIATIVRGFNGTTAAEWAQGTAITVWRPSEDIVEAAIELTFLLYRRKDTDAADTRQILGTGVRIEPHTLPDWITAMLPAPRISLR